jgi:hypothetical protein
MLLSMPGGVSAYPRTRRASGKGFDADLEAAARIDGRVLLVDLPAL